MAIAPSGLLAALFGVTTAGRELTEGVQKQAKSGIHKANAYRAHIYDKSINPDAYNVTMADPLGKGIQSAIGGYSFGKGLEQSDAIKNFFNAKGAEAGGIGSAMADYESSPEAQYWQGDSPYSANEGPSFLKKAPAERSHWSLLDEERKSKNKLGDFTW